MKKLVYLFVSILVLNACSSDSESKEEKGDQKEKAPKDSVINEVPEIEIPESLSGDIGPCDCFKTTKALMERAGNGEDVQNELTGTDQACRELAERMGVENYQIEVELCQRVDTLSIDITGLTSCDCKTQIMEMIGRAGEMESNQALADEFQLIQNKCAILESNLGSTKYKEELKACN